MPELPFSTCSFLVRSDHSSEPTWAQITQEALRENADGFQAYVEPWSDPALDGVGWREIQSLVLATHPDVSVLFIADSVTMAEPDHPILVVGLGPDRDQTPFRCVPGQLWGVDNNLNLSNMDWDEFTRALGPGRVFRGFA